MGKVGFIGCGNMGGALARAAAKSDADLWLADGLAEKAEELAAELGGHAADNEALAAGCDWLFLGVKPQVMPAVLGALAPVLSKRLDHFVLVTMAAGLSVARIRELCGADYPVIRIMPNTPAAVGKGMILYTAEGVTDEEEAEFVRFMDGAGRFDRIPEALIDAGSAISGCGPAFACQFMEALADGGVTCGLPRDKALLYAAQMLAGTAELMLQTGQHPGVLKDAVCSPGGSTIQGVRRLEQGSFRADIIDAVVAAYERTKELGK